MQSVQMILSSYAATPNNRKQFKIDNFQSDYNQNLLSTVPWRKQLYLSEDNASNLQLEISDYFEWASCKKYENDRRTDLIKKIKDVFTYSDLMSNELEVIGSFDTKTSVYFSGVDLLYRYSGLSIEKINFLANQLQKSIGSASFNEQINNDHIIRGQCSRTGIAFNIFFRVQNLPITLVFVRRELCNTIQLVYLFKQFVINRGFNQFKGGFNSFQLDLIVYIYKQFKDEIFEKQKTGSVATEFLQFCQFYASFDAQKYQFLIKDQDQVVLQLKEKTFELFRVIHNKINLFSSSYQFQAIQTALRLSLDQFNKSPMLSSFIYPDPAGLCIREKCLQIALLLGEAVE